MIFAPLPVRGAGGRTFLAGILRLLLAFGLAGGSGVVYAEQHRFGNPDFLIENWLEDDGLPESSAYAVAQTPDGYLWVGTADGIFRYDGLQFAPSGSGTNTPILNGIIQYLYADRSGRLWASGDQGLGVREDEIWRTISCPHLVARSIAEDAAGMVLMGTYDGRVYSVTNDQVRPAAAPGGLTRSGVFCLRDDKDGGMWLANRGFIGRWTSNGWVRFGPAEPTSAPLVAAVSHQGGVWTYAAGTLIHYGPDGTRKQFSAPAVREPRVLLEDRDGAIWIASTEGGCLRLMPGGAVLATANDTNGLVHNSLWCLIQDFEGDFWLGSSCGGLSRLQPRAFHVIGVQEGLPNQIVRTVAEEAPGRMIVGTHGRGTVWIENGRVDPQRPPRAEAEGDYAWSVLHDRLGRTWTGTYDHGLWVDRVGVEERFPLPASLGRTVPCLLEDARGRIWVGTGTGLGVIDHENVVDWSTNSPIAKTSVSSLAEDPKTGDLWVGTYDRGFFRMRDHQFIHYGTEDGLSGDRVTSLLATKEGNLWVGIFGRGLAFLQGGHLDLLGRGRGFPAFTAGFMIEDGLGWLWIGSDHGMMRASEKQLEQVATGRQSRGRFVMFDSSDGLFSADCSQGFQPAAARDQKGNLWFATMNGVVTVDPARVQLNTNPPPVMIEHVYYRDAGGTYHNLYGSATNILDLPPGSVDLNISFAALSFTAPEKNQYSYRVLGFNDNWVSLANHHNVFLHHLPPGSYRLQIRASNNDAIWNDTGVSLNFRFEPDFWQTLWFRVLVLAAVAVAGGFTAWLFTLSRVKRRIARLEQQRALEHERARLATVMEATSDLVAFADNSGKLLHLNPAGYRLLGLAESQDLSQLTLVGMLPPRLAARIADEAIPTARMAGTWEGETALRGQDGHEIPVIQTIMAHRGLQDGDGFLSTIARDITAEKLAEAQSEKLRSQLLQAQKMESVGRLAGGIAHDFNNMLQVIIGNADLALEEVEAGSSLQAELQEIQRSAARSADLTSQLLTFARKQVFRAQELDLNETVTGTSKMLERLIGENIQLVVEAGAGLWSVRMDPSQVTQILANLAINARDAIHGQGRLTIALANAVLTQEQLLDDEIAPGDYVLLSVQDDGQGMSREVLNHLFEPFFTTKAVGKGTGLGLATVFGIVKQNRGWIQVDSAPNQGSTFRIYFPRSAQSSMNTTSATPIRHPVHGNETILIVEDEENILQLIVLTLRKHGYKVLSATAPETALSLVAASPVKIDLLVTDIVMPGMNGKQLQEQLATNQPAMKSLFMSGYTSEVIAQHGDLEEGLNFLQKPFTIQSFLEKVRKILDAP